ncbi:hypothetical protein [Candidatus Methylobacter favarea]|uniref:hypothetical protein n=1 Tax=Candidatus Methylobacter favarea TaxID=2707345 RepID=UPI00157BB7F4|nr:hypothetical protein [Candidatus Methylobacter favarea]
MFILVALLNPLRSIFKQACQDRNGLLIAEHHRSVHFSGDLQFAAWPGEAGSELRSGRNTLCVHNPFYAALAELMPTLWQFIAAPYSEECLLLALDDFSMPKSRNNPIG